MKELLLWQLYEFLSQSHADLDDEVWQLCAHSYQLTEFHAMSWFNVSVVFNPKQTLVAVDDKGRVEEERA